MADKFNLVAVRSALAVSVVAVGLLSQSTIGKPTSANNPELIWMRDQTEIESPRFSPNGKQIVMTIKAHEPDGAEGESYSEKQLDEIFHRKDKNPRWADPEITVIDLGDKSVSKCDYGWQGVFSKEGDKIYYDRQVKPISGLRRLAEPLTGNDICVYDLKAKTSKTLVGAPKVGYLGDPNLSPKGGRLSFTFNDAINGAYGGPIGLGIYDVEDNESSTVLAPAKHHDLYSLVKRNFWAGNTLVAKVDVPTTGGTYMADSYDCMLVNEFGKVLYKVDNAKDACESVESRALPDGKVQVCRHELKTCVTVDPVSGETTQQEKPGSSIGTVSPDGHYTVFSNKRTLVLKDLQTGKQRSYPYKGELRDVVWSSDSTQVAFITDIGATPSPVAPFLRNELWVLHI